MYGIWPHYVHANDASFTFSFTNCAHALEILYLSLLAIIATEVERGNCVYFKFSWL